MADAGGAPGWFRTFERVTKATNGAFALLASTGAAAIVALVLLAIVLRIVGRPLMWPYNIAEFTLVYVFFLALAPALESGHHIRVELFDRMVPRPIRPAVPYIAALLTIIFGVVFCWQLWRMTSRAFGDNRLAIASIVVPLKWVYVAGPIGAIQFILTGFVELGRAYWRETDEPPALKTVAEV